MLGDAYNLPAISQLSVRRFESLFLPLGESTYRITPLFFCLEEPSRKEFLRSFELRSNCVWCSVNRLVKELSFMRNYPQGRDLQDVVIRL